MPLAQPVSSLTPTPTENPNTGAGEVRAAPFQAPLIDPVRFPVVPSTLYNFNQRAFETRLGQRMLSEMVAKARSSK